MHRRFGVFGVELGDDRHTLPPLVLRVDADARPTAPLVAS
jgi:hypothetical protein